MSSGPIVMYIVLRRDLLSALNWPIGALVAQAAHASTAVIWTFKEDPYVVQYLDTANLDSMRKVVVEVDSEEKLREVSKNLKSGGVDHKLWIEMPENIPTCIAVKPQPKSGIQQHFKGLKLFS